MGFRVIFATFLLLIWMILHLASSQTGVCHRSVSSTQTYQVYVSVGSGYTYLCGSWLFGHCSGTRYHSQVEMRTRTVYYSEPVCCKGYTGDGNQCDPICTDCVKPGMCVAPDTCECPAGWTGSQCLDDINECETNVCEHNCTNTNGSYHCICPDGNILDSDQSSCIESPQIVSVNATSSTSLLISWDRPNLDEMDGALETFSVSCSPDEGNTVLVPADSLSAGPLHLSPYTTYTCCVTAHTTTGVSGASCGTQTTLEDVPSDSPVNVTVAAVSPFAVEIEWRPPTTPNGIIINYTVYANNGIIVTVDGFQMNYLYRGLSPYEEVSISVSARTKIGEGPRTIEVHSRTQETVPSVVKNLTVTALSPNLLRISWEPPLSPNGVLTGYQVEVVNLITSTVVRFNKSQDDLQVEQSDGIWPYIPYGISVSATTRVGAGESRETVVFTREGVPLKAPSIVSADRTEATTALIEWEVLSLEDLRGNLSSHEIVYYKLLDEDCPPNTTSSSRMVSFKGIEPQFVITDLDPGLQYCVGVAAKTGAGHGDFSYSLIPWYSNSLFTVVLLEVISCSEWIVEMPAEKVEDLVQEISKSIEQYCRCDIPTNYIAYGKFTCGEDKPELVIFQGQLISTNDRDSSDLLVNLEEWVSSGPTVVIQGKELRVVSSETPPDPSSDKQQEDSNLAGTVTGIVVAMVVSLVLVGFALFGVFYCKRSVRRLERETNGSGDGDPQNLPTEPNPAYGQVNVTQEKEHIYDQCIVADPGLKSRSEAQCFPTQPNPAYGQLGVPHEDDGQYKLCDAATSKLEEQLERETNGSGDKDPQNLPTEPNPAYGQVNVTQEEEHIYDQCIVADPKKERAGLKSRSETQCFPTQPNPAYGQLGVPHEDDGQYELCDAATSKMGEQ